MLMESMNQWKRKIFVSVNGINQKVNICAVNGSVC